jgi:P27 family predicted phage terminase small subunit
MPIRGRLPEQDKPELIVGQIEPPAHLTARAVSVFNDIVGKCSREGYALSSMDGPMLALYATAQADALEHEEAIAKEGWTMRAGEKGYLYPNPRVAMRDAALKRAVGAATKLGLAKLDRRRIPKAALPADDAFAKFIK